MTYQVTPVAKTSEGRLRVQATFYAVERDLYKKGPEAYNALLYKALDHALEEAGGISPFTHTELQRDGAVSPHILVSEEA